MSKLLKSVVGGWGIAVAFAGMSALPVAQAASLRKVGPWLTYQPAAKTVHLKLLAALHDSFNFNGYADGRMVITVPAHWKVEVTVTNRSSGFPHSAMIVPFPDVHKGSGFRPAFKGASVRDPLQGLQPGQTQTFRFVAAKPGKYGIVCGVPGHDSGGMWDVLMVSATAKKPFIKV